MKSTRPIGGFIELDIQKRISNIHKEGYALSNGRACFNLVLQTEQPSKVYVPFYTCHALIEPLLENKIPFEYYSLDEQFELSEKVQVKSNEFIVYINYYALKDEYIVSLEETYMDRLIIDNTMAYFCKEYKHCYSFNSSRKFFGVPDGAFLYAPNQLDISLYPRNINIKYDHLISRILGLKDFYYRQFLESEDNFTSAVYRMSSLSEAILNQIDYGACALKRRDNFSFLHNILGDKNLLYFSLGDNAVPHYYPFLPTKPIQKSLLYLNEIFAPTLWPDIANRGNVGFDWEYKIAEEIIPIPIDHRYGKEDMKRIIDVLNSIS